MNFALSDEQEFLREAARGALSRFKTIEAARAALTDPGALPDLWPMAVQAGWPGMLIGEQHGGAGLSAFDALLVAEECGRVLASLPLLLVSQMSHTFETLSTRAKTIAPLTVAVEGCMSASGPLLNRRRLRPSLLTVHNSFLTSPSSLA